MFGRKKKKQQDKQALADQVQPVRTESVAREKQPPGGKVEYSVGPALAAKLGLSPSVFLELPPAESKKRPKQQSQVRTAPGWRRYLGRVLGAALILALIALLALSLGAVLRLYSQVQSDEIAQVIAQTDVVERRLDDLLRRIASRVDLRQLPERPAPIAEPLRGREMVDRLEERADRLESQIFWLEEQLHVQPVDPGFSQSEFFRPRVLPEYIGWPIVDNEMRQRVAEAWRKLQSLSQRLGALHEHIQPISLLTLEAPEIYPDQAELPADGQTSTGVTVKLLNAERQPYPQPLAVVIHIVEGGGVLEYEGQIGQEVFVPDAESKIHVTYRAGGEPGMVTIVARTGAVEGSASLTLKNIAPAHLDLQLSKPILKADGVDQAILTIQILKEDGGHVPGDTSITINAEPPGVVTLDNIDLQAHDGEAKVTVTAEPGITVDTPVTLMVVVDAVSEERALTVAPGPPPPPAGSQCVVNEYGTRSVYKEQLGSAADFLFDVPAGTVVGCPSELADNMIPVTVTFWIPAPNVSNNLLVVGADSVQITFGLEEPTASDVGVFLSQNANNVPVAIIGQERESQIMVHLQGWMLPEALAHAE